MFRKKISHIDEGQFLKGWKRFRLLSPFNKGWVVDNAENRLPFELSARGLLLVSSTGGGKSSAMTAINLLKLADNPCSICCLDPSGDMMELLAPALKMKGMDVQVFQPSKPSESMCFNPLSDIDPWDRNSINDLSAIIVRSANPQSSPQNQFWEEGACQILSILIEGICTELPPEKHTLETVYYYLNIFMSNRKEVDKLMVNLPKSSYTEYLGIVSAETKMINSFLSTCKVALKLMSSKEVCEVTSKTTFDFSDMRRRKICLFLVVEEFRLKTFSFLSTLFMHSVMNALMVKKSPELKPYLNQFLIWDEWANALTYNEMIPSFLSTCRKKGICTLIMLQSEEQVFQHYSRSEGQIILDNLNTQIYYPGVMNIDTLKKIQILLGKNSRAKFSWWSGYEKSDQPNQPKELMSLEAIRTMKSRGILLTSNLPPVLIKPKPFFRSMWCKWQIRKGRRMYK